MIFAYFFIPQIFFYGVSSLAGAILNARGSFAAPMWTPVINNVVVILVGLGFMATAALGGSLFALLSRGVQQLQDGRVRRYALGITVGVVGVLLYVVIWLGR